MLFYITIILCFIIFYLFQILGQKSKVPQGLKEIPIEKGQPIIGTTKQIERPLCNFLVKLSQKHGPIYRIRIGMRDIVVLNTFEYIKAAFVDNGETFSGRWKAQKFILVANDSGLGFIDGSVWAKQRSFVLKTLKDFGIGRSRSIEIVQEECAHMIENLEKLEGTVFDLPRFISIYTANVICTFLMNKRFSHGDRDFQVIESILANIIKSNDALSNLALMFPFLENNEWLLKFLVWITSRKATVEGFYIILRRQIQEHLKNLDLNSEGEDLMDRFLIIQHQMKERNGDVDTFTDWQLLRNASELISAGYDTTSSTLVYGFMLIAMYPEVQNKVYEEIVDKVGHDRPPTMSDKVSLKYTQAVMDEILRLSTILPLSLFHRTLENVSVKDFFIPKDTVVISNLFACHLDPNVWTKPFEFYPEHFLLTDDSGQLKYKAREELIPFSIGKRQCLGESLARMELFIFFTSVIQRFQVKLAKEKKYFDVFDSTEGVIRTCDVNDFIFLGRR